ncbi:SUMO protein smt3 [Rhodotorula kratochvilovae]
MVKGESGHDGDVKPEASKHQLTIRFGSSEEDLSIKVKGTIRFEKVYKAVAEHKGRDPGSFSLTWDGTRIGKDDTPQSLGFEEEESIDMHIMQVGGGAPSRV